MFKVGDAVALENLAGDEGEYLGDVITEKGRVIEVFPQQHFDYNVRVNWNNGHIYRYREKDLISYNFTLENE